MRMDYPRLPEVVKVWGGHVTSSHLILIAFRGFARRVPLHYVHPRSSSTLFHHSTTWSDHCRDQYSRTVNSLQNHPSPFCDFTPRIIQGNAGHFGDPSKDADSLPSPYVRVCWKDSQSEGVGGGGECPSLGGQDKNRTEAREESEQRLQGCQVHTSVRCSPGRHEIHSREERFLCGE